MQSRTLLPSSKSHARFDRIPTQEVLARSCHECSGLFATNSPSAGRTDARATPNERLELHASGPRPTVPHLSDALANDAGANTGTLPRGRTAAQFRRARRGSAGDIGLLASDNRNTDHLLLELGVPADRRCEPGEPR